MTARNSKYHTIVTMRRILRLEWLRTTANRKLFIWAFHKHSTIYNTQNSDIISEKKSTIH